MIKLGLYVSLKSKVNLPILLPEKSQRIVRKHNKMINT